MSTNSAQPRVRRTQHERSQATRTALLDATIDCLVEYGYAGTTTTRIGERAGVSRGAQVHHFPTKQILVAEAVRHLSARRARAFDEQSAGLPVDTVGTLGAVLDFLWASHDAALFAALLELWVAARTDPQLREVLRDVERDAMGEVWSAAYRLLPEHAKQPTFRAGVETCLAAMRGLALMRIVEDKRHEAREWSQVRARLIATF